MRALWLPVILLLSGCVGLDKAPPLDEIDALRERHSYMSALALLENHQDKIPDRDQRRADLLAEANQYSAQIRTDIEELARQQQYGRAQDLLEQALPELPPSDELNAAATRFYTQRDTYIDRYLDDLYQIRAPQLLREQPVYTILENAGGDVEIQRLVERHRLDTEFFARQLAIAGGRALANNDYAKAAQYLRTANRLAPAPALKQQLNRAEQALQATRQKRQAARSAEREQRYRELAANIRDALDERNYFEARQLLEQARALAIHNEDTETYQRQLDAAIDTFVKQQIQVGDHRYANGHIEAALQIWRQAESLAPSQESKERIEKAQRFMERYQQLQQAPANGK